MHKNTIFETLAHFCGKEIFAGEFEESCRCGVIGVWELIESAFTPPNDLAGENRVSRGGHWGTEPTRLHALGHAMAGTVFEGTNIGFRFVSIHRAALLAWPE